MCYGWGWGEAGWEGRGAKAGHNVSKRENLDFSQHLSSYTTTTATTQPLPPLPHCFPSPTATPHCHCYITTNKTPLPLHYFYYHLHSLLHHCLAATSLPLPLSLPQVIQQSQSLIIHNLWSTAFRHNGSVHLDDIILDFGTFSFF